LTNNDTTAAIANGLAALSYGWDTIPSEWKTGLLCTDLMKKSA
jgi:hypothetical protein